MGKYDLTISDIKAGVNRFLSYVYTSARTSENPEINFIVAGPGAGKSGVENFLKMNFKEKGEKSTSVGADKIAEFHPNYEDAIEELPEVCYKVTRQFVRPAAPLIFDELRKNKINILNERTFNKGQSDIDLVKKFKDDGYKVKINIIATDIFESRLSCFEREARMVQNGDSPRGISKETQNAMYNSFIDEIDQLIELGYCDEVNVFVRGQSINKPKIVYQLGGKNYENFKEAIILERAKQRKNLTNNPAEYLRRIKKAAEIIKTHGINEVLTQNSLRGLEELQIDFIKELSRETQDLEQE